MCLFLCFVSLEIELLKCSLDLDLNIFLSTTFSKCVPLPQGELPACLLAGLILNEVRDQIRAHSDVGSSVAAHLIVVRR